MVKVSVYNSRMKRLKRFKEKGYKPIDILKHGIEICEESKHKVYDDSLETFATTLKIPVFNPMTLWRLKKLSKGGMDVYDVFHTGFHQLLLDEI